jgi:hypothetical protein
MYLGTSVSDQKTSVNRFADIINRNMVHKTFLDPGTASAGYRTIPG